MRVLTNPQPRPVAGVSFGPGGRTLVAGGSGGYDVWDLRTSSRTFIPSHAVKYLYGCVFDPLGRWVYVSDSLRGLRLLPLGGGDPLPTPGSPDERHVPSFGVTRDGRRLVVSRGGAGSNRVECWKVRPAGSFVPDWSIRDGEPVDPEEPYLLNQARWFTNAVAVSPDGRRVVTAESRAAGRAGLRSVLVIRDGATGRAVAELGESAISFSGRLAVGPRSRTLFAWDAGVLERWDLVAGRRTGQLPAPGRGAFRGLVVHPSGRVIVTASGDGQVRSWDASDLSLVRERKLGIGKLHSMAASPDGTSAAAGGDKGKVAVWDFEA